MPKLNKIQSIWSAWINRSLSLKGKVLLISSLMSSILQYPAANTKTPTRVLVEFKKICTDFFWNGRRGKVAYKVLIQDIHEGGLKLPDLATRIKTSHLYWIKHFWDHPESTMALILGDSLKTDNVCYLLESKTQLAPKIHQAHSFLRDILMTWANLHIKEPKEELDLQKELLWDNSYIRIQQKPVTWPRWKEVGILRIKDLIHETQPRFLSHTELTQKYGITVSFLELLQIRSAIPCPWKRKLISQAQQEVVIKPTIYNVVAVRDTKLQAFQFRVVHRFLPCSKFLKNIRIKEEDTCSFCTGSDTIEHFLFTCPFVCVFWRQLISWFEREADINFNISLRVFLFGIPTTVTHDKVINFVLTFAKFFIYRQKLFHAGSLDLTHFLRDLTLRLQVEKYILTLENKQHQFHIWHRIFSALG